MGTTLPICKKEEDEGTEDWNSDRLENQQRNHYPQNPQHPQTYDVPDTYLEQIRLREWDEKMEHLNEKYNLDYSSSSASNSDFEPEHKYETLILHTFYSFYQNQENWFLNYIYEVCSE